MEYMEDTIRYYDENKDEYMQMWNVNFLKNVNFIYPDLFVGYLEKGAHILDLGCGSGRDSLHFTELGYDVTAIDASKEMCDLTAKICPAKVINMNFLDMNFDEEFDGIFACASLLHLNDEDLITCLKLCMKALKKGGMFYISFKYGEGSRFKGKRFFNDMTEERFAGFADKIDGLEIIELWKSERYGDHIPFLNVLARKSG